MSRDLDAVVAEKVMGWRKMEGFWVAPGTPDWVNLYSQPRDPPPFSSDIAAAWQVVEKMVGHGEGNEVRITAGLGRCDVTFDLPGYRPILDRIGDATSDSLPTAICLAALRAVGVPIPETP